MTEHYITLFDRGFLPNGLALHESLGRHAGDATLWVLCIDEETEQVLQRLDLPGVRTIALRDAENDDLRRVRDGRTRAEYCWTLTPFTPDLVFARDPSAQRATYIDADMWLARDPGPILAEFETSGAATLLTEHAYAPEFEQSLQYGIYCVQFMTFTRDSSTDIRQWWQDRCIEWCFATPDSGRFGDQKYLDDWPERFGPRAHVLSHREWTQAPWNAPVFDVDEAITYHFHRLRTISASRASVGLYRLPRPHLDRLYGPYLADLRSAYERLAAVGFTPTPQSRVPGPLSLAKEWAAFRRHQGFDLSTPYSLRF